MSDVLPGVIPGVTPDVVPARSGPAAAGRRARVGAVVALALLLVTLSGCRVDVDTGLEVTASGSGTLAVVVDLDRELVDALTSTGFDPTPQAVEGWEVERTATDDGDRVVVRTSFDTPGELSDRVEDLQDGLGDDDPRLVEAIDLEVDDDGSAVVEATVGVRLPSSTGVEGPGFADAEDLAALAADPDAFGATFTVTMPGRIDDHNADVVRATTAVWDLAPGEEVVAEVSAGPPDLVGGWVLTAILLGALAAMVALGTWLLRRRRRERRDAPYGRVSR